MRIYFSGIGGAGLAPLAMIASDGGHDVLGSDMQKSRISGSIEERGIRVSYEEKVDFLTEQHHSQAIDLFVYTSALPVDHPELIYAQENGIETVKRDGLINLLTKQKGLKMLAVAGTHGKTTTAGMLAWVFERLSIPYSHSVGSSLTFAPIGRYQPGSQYFVYEADEFDRNFLKFTPHASVITSIDYDHPDTYSTKEEYDQAFLEFISKSAYKVLWSKDASRFNIADGADVLVLSEDKLRNHELPNYYGIKLPGAHNRANASLVVKLATQKLGLKKENVVDAINTFPGTDRRFEKLTKTLYTDFAHHPEEISATIQMAREVAENIVVVYQPHQNIRQKHILESGGYGGAFEGTLKVYWLPTYLSREDPHLEIVAPEDLVEGLTNKEDVEITKMDEDLVAKISQHLVNGDLVIGMNAGDLDQFLRKSYLGY